MVTVTVLKGYSAIKDDDIVIPLYPPTFRQTNLIAYFDANAVNKDINNNVGIVYPWKGVKKLVAPSLTNAPLLLELEPNNFIKTDGSARYLVPEPAPQGSVISVSDFSTGFSAFWCGKEKDNTFSHKVFSMFGLYVSLYSVSNVRTLEGKKLYSPNGVNTNGTIQVAAPTTDVLHTWGVTVEPTTVSGSPSAICRLWIDGVLVASSTSVAWLQCLIDSSSLSATTYFGSNGSTSANSSKFEFGAWAIYNTRIANDDVLNLHNTWKNQYGF